MTDETTTTETPTIETTANPALTLALAQAYAAARQALDVEHHTRLASAWDLALDGDVTIELDGSAWVRGKDQPEYRVEREHGCNCADATSRRAVKGWCKHLLAVALVKRARAIMAQEKAPAPDHHVALRPDFITHIKGKNFVQFAGLLAMAHDAGLQSLVADFIVVTPDLATARATAVFADGRTFSECADASPSNVGAHIRPHFARMALTRAKARCLRDALNIGMTSLEELADLDDASSNGAKRPPFVPEAANGWNYKHTD